MSIHLIIEQEGAVVADVPDYEGPVPRKDEYILHPPRDAVPRKDWSGQSFHQVAGCVKTVEWGIYARRVHGEGCFIWTEHPFVKVTI